MIASRISTAFFRAFTVVALASALALQPLTASADMSKTVKFDIDPQQLSDALMKYSAQSGVQVTSPSDLLEGKSSSAVIGAFSAQDALKRLLDGTSLAYDVVGASTVTIRQAKRTANTASTGPTEAASLRLVRAQADKSGELQKGPHAKAEGTGIDAPSSQEAQHGKGIPEILVKGSKLINSDIRRTEDDVQPYVVFSAREIEASMATNLEDFLKTRLPMNTTQSTNSQNTNGSGWFGSESEIDLRGLGADQTLVLVNGRRMPSVSGSIGGGGDFNQPDINGIPLSAVERIEVLPSTASGIYGGGATGGVINIITKGDYRGLQVQANYDNTFDSDAARMRLDATAGFALEEGRTHVFLTASRTESNILESGDRDFTTRARNLYRTNDPDGLIAGFYPPDGYTTNIRSTDGSDLVLDGGTPLGSSVTSVPLGYAGPGTDGGTALVGNAGVYNLDLPDSLNGTRQPLLVSPTVTAFTASVRRELSGRIEAFVDVSRRENDSRTHAATFPSHISSLDADSPNNPFTTDVRVTFPTHGYMLPVLTESRSTTATAGIILRLPRDWMTELDYTWGSSRSSFSRSTPLSAEGTAAVNAGEFDVMRDLALHPLDFSPYLLPTPNTVMGPSETRLDDVTLRLAGPLLDLPAGPIAVSALLERRKEVAEGTYQDTYFSGNFQTYFYPERSREVDSVYLEMNLPVLSADNALAFAQMLDFQASIRRDDYTTTGVSGRSIVLESRQDPIPEYIVGTNEISSRGETLGLRFAPLEDMMLRVSYNTGFLPPSVSQIVPSISQSFPFYADPKRGNVRGSHGVTTVTRDGNSELKPEESQSWSAGAVFTPRVLPGLRLSVDYTQIEKTNEISSLSFQEVVDLEAFFPDRITREPLEPDAPAEFTAGRISAIDNSLVNIAYSRIQAYDFQVDYLWRTQRWGRFHLYGLATRQTELARKTLEESPLEQLMGYRNGPLKWRGNLGFTWERQHWTFGWNAQVYDSYLYYNNSDIGSQTRIDRWVVPQGSDTIPRQIYHDTFARYRFDPADSFGGGFLDDLEIQLGIRNVFDKSPPILAHTGTAGGYSHYGDPRLRNYSISVRKSY